MTPEEFYRLDLQHKNKVFNTLVDRFFISALVFWIGFVVICFIDPINPFSFSKLDLFLTFLIAPIIGAISLVFAVSTICIAYFAIQMFCIFYIWITAQDVRN